MIHVFITKITAVLCTVCRSRFFVCYVSEACAYLLFSPWFSLMRYTQAAPIISMIPASTSILISGGSPPWGVNKARMVPPKAAAIICGSTHVSSAQCVGQDGERQCQHGSPCTTYQQEGNEEHIRVVYEVGGNETYTSQNKAE